MTRLVYCRRCQKLAEPVSPRSVYCSPECQSEARQEQSRDSHRRRYTEDPAFRREHLARVARVKKRDPSTVGTGPLPLNRSERTCPSCKIRHRVPRSLPKLTSVLAVPLDRYQLKSMYALAVEFIDAGGGEVVATDEACEECGRWSIVAFLDWLAPDVEKSA